MLLKDRVAIITGGGSGIGQGVAQRFAKEGAKLMLVDLNPAGLEETAAQVKEAGAEVETFEADVSMTEQVEAFFAGEVHADDGANFGVPIHFARRLLPSQDQ